MKKVVMVLVVLAATGGLGFGVWSKLAEKTAGGGGPGAGGRRGGGGGGGGAATVAVETALVRRATVRDVRTLSGTLEPGARVIVSAKVGGRLEMLRVRLGDVVQHGDLLAVLDDAEHRLAEAEAAAELDVAKQHVEGARSALRMAGRELARKKSLRETNLVTQAELDVAQADAEVKQAALDVALAQVAQREAALEAARVRRSHTRVHATWATDPNSPDALAAGAGASPSAATAGARLVGERYVDEGTLLTPNTPIVSLIAVDPIVAVVHVIERDYARIRVGQEAALETDAYPGRAFVGRVTRVAPRLVESSRQARVELELPNGEALLKPGMFGRVRIELARREDAVVVPRDAVVRRGGRTGVFQLDASGEKARFVAVRTGIVTDAGAEVLEPALEGAVVTLGNHLLVDGTPVHVAAVEAPPPEAADPEAREPAGAPADANR